MYYGRNELYHALGSTDPRLLPGFIIKTDGIWIDELPEQDTKFLTPSELSALCAPFVAHDTTKPVVQFPCTGEQLRHFLKVTDFDTALINPIITGDLLHSPHSKESVTIEIEIPLALAPLHVIEKPETYADRRRMEGASKELIACELHELFRDELQWHSIARLAAPSKTYTDEQEKNGNPRKNGQAWSKKGEQMKLMTTS